MKFPGSVVILAMSTAPAPIADRALPSADTAAADSDCIAAEDVADEATQLESWDAHRGEGARVRGGGFFRDDRLAAFQQRHMLVSAAVTRVSGRRWRAA